MKVLITTYYWPPAGGPGVQRWLMFVKYLKDFDIEPIVYIPENPNYPILDETLVNEVSKEITILKLPIKEPYRWAGFLSKKKTKTISSGMISNKKQSLLERFLLWVRGNFFIPDARKNWVKPSVTFLKKYLKENPIEVVITSGPPHSLHLIGMQLQKQLSLKWIADFRDPWTSIGYHKKLKLSKKAQKKHLFLEKQVLQNANNLIVTSNHTKKEFQQITDKPITVITNGYDFEAKNVVLDKKFTISHIGSLLSERNPEVLWKALSELIAEDQDFAEHFELQLAGIVSEDVLESIKKYRLENNTSILGYLSHQEAAKIRNASQVLLLVEIDSEDTKAIIPGKLFEYLASKRPILAIGPKNSEVASIISDTQSGVYFYYTQKEEIKKVLKKWYQKFKTDTLQLESVGVEQYHRKNLTKKLSGIIKNLPQ